MVVPGKVVRIRGVVGWIVIRMSGSALTRAGLEGIRG